MDSRFLILSGVVLSAGVLYWLWSHIQLTQKKVQLLENAVFELRSMMPTTRNTRPDPETEAAAVYNDLADDDEWGADASASPSPSPSAPSDAGSASTPLDSLVVSDDLQPGGRIDLPPVEETETQFRDLFIQHERTEKEEKGSESKGSESKGSESKGSNESLDSMPVRDLRRLAEQRGITGVSELKKKELISALRQTVAKEEPVSAEADAEAESELRELTLE